MIKQEYLEPDEKYITWTTNTLKRHLKNTEVDVEERQRIQLEIKHRENEDYEWTKK